MDSLERALERLAAPGSDQLASQPRGSHRPDEIALDYHDHWLYWKPRLWAGFSDEQRQSLDAVATMLNTMSKCGNAQVWTDEGVLIHPYWTELRRLANVELHELRKANAPSKFA
jgi:hypothetical protein